jgi:hypothetical protein
MTPFHRTTERPLRERLLDNLRRFGPRRLKDLAVLLRYSEGYLWIVMKSLEKEQKVFHGTDGRWEFISV